MEIGAWLRGLGLERYEASFRDNDIDAEVLTELTADDLIGLGVSSIGHRRKLLAAIGQLHRTDATIPIAVPEPPQRPVPPAFQKLAHRLPFESDQTRRGPVPLRGGSTTVALPEARSIFAMWSLPSDAYQTSLPGVTVMP